MAKPDKASFLAEYKSVRAEIKAAEDVIKDLNVKIAPTIAALVKAHGPGPHKVKVGDRVLLVTFRKAGDTFRSYEQDLTAMLASDEG